MRKEFFQTKKFLIPHEVLQQVVYKAFCIYLWTLGRPVCHDPSLTICPVREGPILRALQAKIELSL